MAVAVAVTVAVTVTVAVAVTVSVTVAEAVSDSEAWTLLSLPGGVYWFGTKMNVAPRLMLLLLFGCGEETAEGSSPLFPPDYAERYSLVRTCRRSIDHDTQYVRIFADPVAEPTYTSREGLFPEGSVLVKEEYDFIDETCSGEILSFSVMVRLAEGASPETLGWRWQKVTAARRVESDDDFGCYNCHGGNNCEPPVGYEFTCSQP